MDAEERELIETCLAGDEAARGRLYARHAGFVMAYLLRSGFARAEAEDVLQETFLRVFRSLDTFDESRGAFHSWLGAVARNAARRQWGRRRETDRFDPELAEEALAAREEADSLPAAREEADAVRTCVSGLPEEHRRIVELRYVDGLTLRAVAEAAGMPEATVRLRLREAHGLLEQGLKEAGVVG